MSTFWAAQHVATQNFAATTAADASRKAADATSKANEVEAKCDKALLVCEAMWTLLRDKLGVTEQELVDRVNDIDLSDGRLDGKVRRPAVECANCHRKIARRFQRCLYCGHAIDHAPFSA